MKRKVLALILALTMFSALSITAFADGDATVTFNKDNTLEYSGVTDGSLGNAFSGIAPGETKELVINVKNDNSHTADFYMSADVLKALETENAKGAGYDVVLKAGETVLYSSELGGYTGSVSKEDGINVEADGTGLGAINETLQGDVLFATLESGGSIPLILSITFDGEAMGNDYTGTNGEIAFNFKAGYQDPTGTTVIVREVTENGQVRYVRKIVEIIEGAVPLGAVATGDGAMIGLAAVALLVGGFMVILGRKKKAEE